MHSDYASPQNEADVEELDRAYRRIEELELELRDLQNDYNALRKERWHATYNAALTGQHAFTGCSPEHVKDAHDAARAAADGAHGKLKG